MKNEEIRRDHGSSISFRRESNSDSVTPATATLFWREVWPERMVMSRRGRPKILDRRMTSASFAAPSTGGEASCMASAGPRTPAMAVRRARGVTRTANVRPAGPDDRGISKTDVCQPRSSATRGVCSAGQAEEAAGVSALRGRWRSSRSSGLSCSRMNSSAW